MKIEGKTAGGRVYVRTSIDERFWRLVDKRGTDDCWIWQGATTSTGYGSFHGDRKTRRAHQVSWMLAGNAAPERPYELCHTCDTRLCVNPSHLFLGTRSDNMRDASRKGRLVQQRRPGLRARGSKHHQAKLNESQVREIRSLAAAGSSLRSIAKHFGVSDTLVGMIVKRLWWRHVEA